MKKGIGFVIALALLAGIPILANSGGAIAVITSHPLSFSLKLVEQAQASNGDDRARKDTIDWKEVFEECVGAPPTSKQAIYLFIDCDDPSSNTIMAINTDPVTGIEDIGGVTFDFGHQIVVEREDNVRQVLLPAIVDLECNGTTDISLQGVLDLKLTGDAPNECPDSGKLTLSGSGNTPSVFGNLLMNAGSTITVKKRNPAITSIPPIF